MDLGAAAEGICGAVVAILSVLSWPVWIVALIFAGSAAARRSVPVAVVALAALTVLHAWLLQVGLWDVMFNPFSASPFRSPFWAVVYLLASACILTLSVWGIVNRRAGRAVKPSDAS